MSAPEYGDPSTWNLKVDQYLDATNIVDRENLAIGGGIIQGEDLGDRTGFADPIKKPITDDFFKKYLKSNKGKSFLEMAEDLTSKGYIPATKAAKVLSAEALTGRAARLGIKGAASFIKDQSLQDVLREATDATRLAYKRGEIDEALLRKRVIGKRADIKRYNDPKTYREILKQREDYRNKIKTDPLMEEQRKSVKASQAKFKAKEYLKYGIPPQAKTAKQFLFRDLFRIAQESEKGDRLKLAKNFAKSDLKAGKFYNNLEIIDTVTGKRFNFNNVEKYISSKNTGFNYKDVIKPYEQKVFINETPGLRTEINSKMIPNWDTGNKNTFFEIQHVEGKYKNPFNVHLASKFSNVREGVVRARFDKAWAKTKTLSDKKELFQEYTDNLPKGIASQPGMITRTREFGERVPFDELLRETKQSGVKLPRGILKNASKLNSVLIPGLEEIVEGMKNIPDDIAKKAYFKLGLKALGPIGTYLIVDDTYEALKEGKSVLESLESGLLGTNVIGSTKDVFDLSPEEREARSVVKQSEMNQQISDDFSGLDSDFATPAIQSDLSIDEAEKKYKSGQEAVKLKREAEEADIARARAVSVEGLKNLMLGERFQPAEIPKEFLAVGGRVGLADGPDDPSKRKFFKIAGGLASIPILGKFIKPAAKVVESAAPAVKEALVEVPAYFWNLVAKIKKLGDDVTQTQSLADRQVVTKYKDYELTEDIATGQIDIQRAKVLEDTDYYGAPLGEESYMTYKPGQVVDDAKGIKSAPDYEEGAAHIHTTGPDKGGLIDDALNLPEDIIEEAMEQTIKIK